MPSISKALDWKSSMGMKIQEKEKEMQNARL